MYSTKQELKLWLDKKNIQKNIDALSKTLKDKKVIIYGAGILSELIFENYDLSKVNIIAVADRKFFSVDDKFMGYKGINPIDLPDLEFDGVLIAVYNDSDVKWTLKEEILEDFGKKVIIESIVKKSFIEKVKDFIHS